MQTNNQRKRVSWQTANRQRRSDRKPYNLLFVNDLRSLFAVSERGSSPDLEAQTMKSVAAPFPRWNAAGSNLARFLVAIRCWNFGARVFRLFERRLERGA
jgi:hypothetical protein